MTDESIEKFRAIFKAKYGREISREEAIERGTRLIRFVKALCILMTKGEDENKAHPRVEKYFKGDIGYEK